MEANKALHWLSPNGCPQFEGILPKGPYLPCLSMAGRALLAGYHWILQNITVTSQECDGVSSVYSNVCSGADQRKHQSSTSLALPVNSLHKSPVTWKMFPFWRHHGISCSCEWPVLLAPGTCGGIYQSGLQTHVHEHFLCNFSQLNVTKQL